MLVHTYCSICSYVFRVENVYLSIAPPFFDSEVTEELTEVTFKSFHVNDFAYDLGDNMVMLKWKPIRIPSIVTNMFRGSYTVDVSLHSLDPQTKTRSFFRNLATNVPNTGSLETLLPSIDEPYMVVAIGISISENSISEALDSLNNGNQDDDDDISITDVGKYIKKLKKVIKYIKKPVTLLKDIAIDAAKRIGCETFCHLEPDNIGNEINQRLPPCPPTSNRAKRDSQFTREIPLLELATTGTFGQCFAQSVFDRYVSEATYVRSIATYVVKLYLHKHAHNYPLNMRVYVCTYVYRLGVSDCEILKHHDSRTYIHIRITYDYENCHDRLS